MCAVESERSVVVCDIAIQRVREALTTALPHGITYRVVEGRGTRVDADATVDADQFAALVQQAIAAAQNG
jgi:hypothetical protein